MPIGAKYKSGDKNNEDGFFTFDSYTDGTQTPSPTEPERAIKLKPGETFPPIRSANNKACYWLQKR